MVEFMSAREFKDYLDEIKQSNKFKEYYTKLVLTAEGKDIQNKNEYIEKKVKDWLNWYVKKKLGYTVLQYQKKIRGNIVREYKNKGYVAFEVEWRLYKHWHGGRWQVYNRLYGSIVQYTGVYLHYSLLEGSGYSKNVSSYYIAIAELNYYYLNDLIKAEEILKKLPECEMLEDRFLDYLDSSETRKKFLGGSSFGDLFIEFMDKEYNVDATGEVWSEFSKFLF